MRIVFTSWRDLAHPQAGGAEVLIDRLARGLQDRGHVVALMCGGPVGPRPYPVVDLGGTFTQYLRAPLEHRRRFADWDLLVDTENGLPFFAPQWRRGPVLCLVHHVHTEQWADRFPAPLAAAGRWAEREVMPRAYRQVPFVAVSPSTGEALRALGVSPSLVSVAPLNGVDLPAATGVEDPDPLFVALGRLVPHKRVDRLLALWPEVRRRTGGRLVVVGDGPEHQRLAAEAPEGVEMAGRVDDATKAELLGRAWLLVHAAAHEGWGAVILEAGAAGTPTVAFDVPGVRDAVVDGESGELVDDDRAFVERWVALADDPGRRAELGRGARLQAERYSWERSLDEFEALVLRAAARGGVERQRPAA